MAWTTLKAAVAAIVKTNGAQEITGANLQSTLNSIIDNVGQNSTFKGVATTSTNPGTPDGNVFYLANQVGTYSNFSGLSITTMGLYVINNITGSWVISKVAELRGIGFSPKLAWLTNIGNLIESYDSGTGDLTITWDESMVLIVGNNKYGTFPANSLVLEAAYDFAYVDVTLSTGSVSAISIGQWNDGVTDWNSKDLDKVRVILFQRSGSLAHRLAFSLLDETVFVKDKVQRTLYKSFDFDTAQAVYISGVWTPSVNWLSKKIEVQEGEKILYRVHSASPAYIVTFLDFEDNILSYVAATGADYVTAKLGELEAPANTKYAVISTFTGYGDSYWILSPRSTHRILQLEEQYAELGLSYLFNLKGVYVSSSWVESVNWESIKLEIGEGIKIKYLLHSTTSAHLITFLDDTESIISYVASASTPVSTVQTGEALTPANTKYVVITTYTGYEDSYYQIEDFINLRLKLLESRTKAIVASTPKTIVVDKNLTEDADSFIFNTIAGAIAVATGVDTIYIFGEEATPYEEYGLELPDGLTMIGIGTPYIKGELPEDATTAEIDPTSTIDAYYGCTLENLIVSAKNMRYPIHADFSNGNTVRNIKNCKFIHYGNQEAYDYRVLNGWTSPDAPTQVFRAMSAWGGGTKAGDRVYIEGCYFESVNRAFSTHNNADFDDDNGASLVIVRNSEFKSHGVDRDGSNMSFLSSLHIQHLDSNTEDLIILDNCKINGYITNQLSGTILSHKLICNTPDLKQVWNSAGSNYDLDPQWDELNVTWYARIKGEITAFKNMNAGTLSRGKAVKRSGIGIDLYTSSDSISDFLGILMEDVESGKTGDVKFAGYLPWKYFNNPTYVIADGADVSVDGSGNFVQDSSHVVANAVDNYNILIS